MLDIKFQSRKDLPHLLNSLGLKGYGVEVGVQRGVNALHIRQQWEGAKLFLVDPWKPYWGTVTTQEMHDSYHRDCIAHMEMTKPGGWEILRMASLEGAAELHKLGITLDFAYLDGAHEYSEVVKDIGVWWPLIKSGGVLAGHDYVPDGWHRNGDPITAFASPEEAGVERGHCGPFEVVKAVQEFFGPNGHTPLDLYITDANTDEGWRSWLVVKP